MNFIFPEFNEQAILIAISKTIVKRQSNETTYTFGTSWNLMFSKFGSKARVACAIGCTASKSHGKSTSFGGDFKKLR